VSASLDQDRLAGRQQLFHQRIDIALQQRLSTGNLHEIAGVSLDARHDVIHRHLPAFGKGIRRIAPRAPEIAGRQAHEDAGASGVGRFPLDGVKDFVDREHWLHCTKSSEPAGSGRNTRMPKPTFYWKPT
jgi:hypothetical protein